MALIQELDFIGIPSQDAERARSFYRDVLGMRPDEHAAIFADPDGNHLMLHRRYAAYCTVQDEQRKDPEHPKQRESHEYSEVL